MAYPDPVPPHQAQPPATPPIQSESLESDPSKMMDSSSFSSSTPDDGFALADHGPPGLMLNGSLP